MKERIKKLRKALGLTQQEFADRIGISRGNIATYETREGSPGSSVISLICREFHVNEAWLRTGEGEMFVQMEPETAVTRLCAELSASELEAEALRLYFQIDPKIRESFIRQLFKVVEADYHLASAAKAQQEKEPAAKVQQDPDIDAEVEAYRQRLLLEKRQASQTSAVNGSGAG